MHPAADPGAPACRLDHGVTGADRMFDDVNWLRVGWAILLIFFLPGYFLVQALFPRKRELDEEYDWLFKLVLGSVLSIALVILVGFVLAHPRVAMFNATSVTVSLVLLTLTLFIIAWWRGAFPVLGRAAEPVPIQAISGDERVTLHELMEEWRELRKKAQRYQMDISRMAPGRKRERALARLERVETRLAEIDVRIKQLGSGQMSLETMNELDELLAEWKRVKRKLDEAEDRLAAARPGDRRSLTSKRDRLRARLDRIDGQLGELRAQQAKR